MTHQRTEDEEIRRLINRSVDDRLGPPRPAPAFLPSRPSRRLRPWLLPLVAAACVVAAAAGTVGATQLLSDRRAATPAGPTPTAGTSAPSSSATAKVSAHASPHPSHTARTVGNPGPGYPGSPASSPPGTSAGGQSSANPPASSTVSLGDVTLTLPTGWTGTALPTPSDGPMQLCLSASNGLADACDARLVVLLPGSSQRVDSDVLDGFAVDGQYCNGNLKQASISTTASTASFGGRDADHRTFVVSCADGSVVRVEQYVAAQNPGVMLISDKDDDQISAALAGMVSTASLPSATSPLRLYDHGIIRSIVPEGATSSSPGNSDVAVNSVLTIDRTTPGLDDGPSTYDYPVTKDQIAQLGLTVGQEVSVYTDGAFTTGVVIGPVAPAGP